MMVDPKDIPDELIDALLANYQKPDDLLGKNGIGTTDQASYGARFASGDDLPSGA